MQLDDSPAAGCLVEDVDVLGDDPRKEPLALQSGQDAVGESRPDLADRGDEVAGELVEVAGVAAEPFDLEDLLGVVAAGHVEPPQPAEIGDPRRCGDPCPGKGDREGGAPDQLGTAGRFERIFF